MPSLRTVLKCGMMNTRFRNFLVSNGRIFFIRLSHFLLLEYNDLLRDFSANICYVPHEFHFVVNGNIKHFEIFSSVKYFRSRIVV